MNKDSDVAFTTIDKAIVIIAFVNNEDSSPVLPLFSYPLSQLPLQPDLYLHAHAGPVHQLPLLHLHLPRGEDGWTLQTSQLCPESAALYCGG